MSARDEVLARVRAALADAPSGPVPVPRGYRERAARAGADRAAVLDRFVERVEDYRATVTRVDADGLADAVAEAVGGRDPVVVPPGLPHDLAEALGARMLVLVDGEPEVLSATRLDTMAAVVTGATVGIAETGTIVLCHGTDSPGQGRRALSLVPDRHVCVVLADQVVASVPEAVARLDATRPQTWVSGPSATSDIELNRVEGVHGPRVLHVVLVV